MSVQLSPRLRFDSLNRLNSKLTGDLESHARGGASPRQAATTSASLRTSSSALLSASATVSGYSTPTYHSPAGAAPIRASSLSMVDSASRTPPGGLLPDHPLGRLDRRKAIRLGERKKNPPEVS